MFTNEEMQISATSANPSVPDSAVDRQPSEAAPRLPGINFLGCGYDLSMPVGRDAGIRARLYQLKFDQPRLARVGERDYAVPAGVDDGIDSPVELRKMETLVAETLQELEEKWKTAHSLSYKGGVDGLPSFLSSGSKFEAELGVRFGSKYVSKRNQRFVDISKEVHLKSARLDPSSLRLTDEAAGHVERLKRRMEQGTLDAQAIDVKEFVQKYGFVVVTGVRIGGALEMWESFTLEESQTEQEFEAQLRLAISDFETSNQVTSEDRRRLLHTIQRVSDQRRGGDLSIQKTEENWAGRWIESVVEKPTAYGFTSQGLMPFYDLPELESVRPRLIEILEKKGSWLREQLQAKGRVLDVRPVEVITGLVVHYERDSSTPDGFSGLVSDDGKVQDFNRSAGGDHVRLAYRQEEVTFTWRNGAYRSDKPVVSALLSYAGNRNNMWKRTREREPAGGNPALPHLEAVMRVGGGNDKTGVADFNRGVKGSRDIFLLLEKKAGVELSQVVTALRSLNRSNTGSLPTTPGWTTVTEVDNANNQDFTQTTGGKRAIFLQYRRGEAQGEG